MLGLAVAHSRSGVCRIPSRADGSPILCFRAGTVLGCRLSRLNPSASNLSGSSYSVGAVGWPPSGRSRTQPLGAEHVHLFLELFLEAIGEPCRPSGPVERETLESRRVRLARIRGHRFWGRQHGWNQVAVGDRTWAG